MFTFIVLCVYKLIIIIGNSDCLDDDLALTYLVLILIDRLFLYCCVEIEEQNDEIIFS